MKETLKVCFRCKTPEVSLNNYGSDGKIVVCRHCGLMSPFFQTEKEVIDWWNNRKKEITTFTFTCPECEYQHKVTSKKGWGGVCHTGDIPYDVAEDLHGDEIICNCGKTIVLEAEINAYMWVKIKQTEE